MKKTSPSQYDADPSKEGIRMPENLVRQKNLQTLPGASDLQDKYDVFEHCLKGKSATSAWVPVESKNEITYVEKIIKLKNITRGAEKYNLDYEILDRIKISRIGRFYINHLKKIYIFRSTTIWLWRKLYPLYANKIAANFGSRESKRWRPIISLKSAVKEFKLSTVGVFDAVSINTPAPVVISESDNVVLDSPHDYYEFPEIYVVEISNSYIHAGSNLIFAHDSVICHDLYDFNLDYTSEELHGRHLIDVKKRRMRLLCEDITPEEIEEAAIFVDACASNYAHWITEVLPRIAAFCSMKKYENVPVVIDGGLHSNIMESLFAIVGSEREIIALSVGRGIVVNKAYVTSAAGYVPFERRSQKLLGHSHGKFSPQSLGLIFDRCSSLVRDSLITEYPKKIFLRRVSGGRQIVNGAELEEFLLAQGFSIVQPEKLTFLQQVALFKNAEIIIGSSGAAFSNLIFSSCNVKCIILIGKYENTSYWYWQNIARASGKKISYILGDLKNSQNGIHGDFEIDLQSVKKSLG